MYDRKISKYTRKFRAKNTLQETKHIYQTGQFRICFVTYKPILFIKFYKLDVLNTIKNSEMTNLLL